MNVNLFVFQFIQSILVERTMRVMVVARAQPIEQLSHYPWFLLHCEEEAVLPVSYMGLTISLKVRRPAKLIE